MLLFHESHRNIHEFFLECSYPPQPVMEAVWRALDMLRAEALSAASPPAHNPPAPPPSPRLELNLTKFARRIPECQTAAQLGAAIKFYEGKGHLTRGQTAQNHGWLQSPRPVPDLERAVQGAVTQRATLVQSLIARYGAQLEAGVRATYWQLGRLSGLQEDQLKRALADLRREGLIQWHPPETGRPVTLLVPGSEPPLIDYQEQQQLKQAEQVNPPQIVYPPQILYPPKYYTPPNTIPPQILYPPKYYTPLGLISVLPNTIPPQILYPPKYYTPPNTIPPQILYPPWLNKRFAKYYTPPNTIPPQILYPPKYYTPPNTIPPQILYPPWLNKRFAKYYTPPNTIPPQILYPPKYYTPLGLISVLPNTIPPFHHIQANETRTDSGYGLNTTAQ